MPAQILQSESLKSIPPKKLHRELTRTLEDCETCTSLSELCSKCSTLNAVKRRWADSNIPVGYWNLHMKDFKGSGILLKKYEEVIEDLDKVYDEGWCWCFAGNNGVGKTYVVTNILKKATVKGFQCLYVTLSDIVAMAVSNSSDKYIARKELMTVDFLVIDEFDGRHMTAGAGSDLFGRQLEDIFRKRTENQLPLLFCTNSPQILDSFEGPLKQSIGSLMSYTKTIPVVGKDFRKELNG